TKASKGGVGRWRVHASPVIDGPTVDLPISPYVLGYWLGDGDSDCPRITVGDEDLSFVLHQLAAEGVAVGVAEPTNAPPPAHLRGATPLVRAAPAGRRGGRGGRAEAD